MMVSSNPNTSHASLVPPVMRRGTICGRLAALVAALHLAACRPPQPPGSDGGAIGSSRAAVSATTSSPASAAPSASAVPTAATDRDAKDAIGVARLKPDGTIELDMFRPSARLTYRPDHPQYVEIRAHLTQRGGLLLPGQERPVLPFPPPAVPVTSVKMAGAVAREVARETASWGAGDARRTADVFVGADGAPRFSTLARTSPHPGKPGLRIPSPVVGTLARAVAEVEAERAKIEDYDVEASVPAAGSTVELTLVPHFAPGEAPHPGGGTSLGKELHLSFDASTSALLKKLYAR